MIYTLVFNKMLQKLSNKQSTMSMKSEAFKKKQTRTHKEFPKSSHISIPISQVTPKMHNKSTVVALRKANNKNSRNLLASYKNQIGYLLSEIYFAQEEIKEKKTKLSKILST